MHQHGPPWQGQCRQQRLQQRRDVRGQLNVLGTPVLAGRAGVTLSHGVAQASATTIFPRSDVVHALASQAPFVGKQRTLQQWLCQHGCLPAYGRSLRFCISLYVVARPWQALYAALILQQAVGTLHSGQ
ncbi:hypothetical protein D9M71_595200 [compost metagenome]